MLCRMLLERLPPHVETLYLANPSLSRQEILGAIADELGIPTDGKATHSLTRALQDALIARYAEGKRVVLLIDEAHAMPAESLEEIRLLSNLESKATKLLQIALFAQPELDERLAATDMRQLRERILRVRVLLDCLLSAQPAVTAAQLMAQLVMVGQERRSLRALLASNSSLLAAKVAERSAETGEHYITRTSAEYRSMLRKAAGGGALMAFTTLIKFGLYALALSAFWGGFMAGINYAVSFVLIQLLHFTVATKQPAMTAPAMAAKLKELGTGDAIESFVDEVSHLVRSQVAAVLGNVLVVMPVVMLLSWGLASVLGAPFLSEDKALHVLESLHLLGPSVLFAAFTGVLLFASSLVAGWAENSFVLHRLDSALRYNPRITAVLGNARAARWARFMRENISGFAANISLGFMLGLVPAFAGFFGLGLEVRHVTLAAGQIGVAAVTLGLDAVHTPALWWAVAALPLMGMLNVGVSFYQAFRLALRAHNVSGVDRSRIYAAIRQRLRRAPLGFFWPPRTPAATAEEPPRHG